MCKLQFLKVRFFLGGLGEQLCVVMLTDKSNQLLGEE
jgi:hypothetical protein